MRPTDEEEYQEILEKYEQDQRDNEEYNEILQQYQKDQLDKEIKKDLQRIKKREYLRNYRAIHNDRYICKQCGGCYTTLNFRAHLNTQKHYKAIKPYLKIAWYQAIDY